MKPNEREYRPTPIDDALGTLYYVAHELTDGFNASWGKTPEQRDAKGKEIMLRELETLCAFMQASLPEGYWAWDSRNHVWHRLQRPHARAAALCWGYGNVRPRESWKLISHRRPVDAGSICAVCDTPFLDQTPVSARGGM